MEDILFDLGVSTLLTYIKKAAKSDKLKRQLKAVMLKIAKGILGVYGADPDFAVEKLKA